MIHSSHPLLATAAGFTSAHIALTALIAGMIAAGIATWQITGRHRAVTIAAMAVTVTATVYLWRRSADMPQLNNDGLSGFSANDWLAPIATFVALTLYKDLRPPTDQHRFNQARALITIAAFAVNVITI